MIAVRARHPVRRRATTAFAEVEPVEPVDRFTIGHGMIGFCLGLWGVPWWVALTSTIGFELIENFVLKPNLPRIFPVGTRDTLANSTFDSIAWMGGWAAARGIFHAEADRAPVWRRRARVTTA